MKDLEKMTVRELEHVEREVAEKRDMLGRTHKAIRHELDKRSKEREVADKVSAMSPAEKTSLLQMLQAASIAPEEKFGNLGG